MFLTDAIARRATIFVISLVRTHPWKEEPRVTSQSNGMCVEGFSVKKGLLGALLVDTLKEDTGMANTSKLMTLRHDLMNRVRCRARRESKE